MPRILVVEDEKSLRILYRKELELEGYSVVTARDAAEAFEALENEAPDLVVLDIRLPHEDGLAAMGRMQSRRPRIPIVLNTAYVSSMDSFLSWPADAYVVKSTDACELRSKIRELLPPLRLQDQAEQGPGLDGLDEVEVESRLLRP